MTLMDTSLEGAGIISIVNRSRRKTGMFKANLQGLLLTTIELFKVGGKARKRCYMMPNSVFMSSRIDRAATSSNQLMIFLQRNIISSVTLI